MLHKDIRGCPQPSPLFNLSLCHGGNVSLLFLSWFFLASRKDEVGSIRSKFPNKVPVIVERYQKEKDLPILDKTKFLVPEELTLSQFVTIIRYSC